MKIDELREKVESYRAGLKDKSGKVMWSGNGPVGMSVIDAMLAVIESQELRIAEIEAHSGVTTPHGTFPSGLESKGVHDQAVAVQRVKEAAGEEARRELGG